MNDDMGFDEKMKELCGTLCDALSGMADKVNGALNSKGFQINARRVLAGRLREAAERPDLSWPALCDVLCVSGRNEAVRALAAMVDPKYAPTEEERRILDMWPRYEDGEPVMIGDGVDGLGGEIIEVYIAENAAAIWNNSANHMHLSPGERVKRPAPEVLDADGVEIKVGDTVWDDDGVEMTVMSLVGELPGHVTTHSDNPPAMHSISPKRLTHTRPDSWERLEEDAGEDPFRYCKTVGKRLDTFDNAEVFKSADIVRRAKKLAEVE